MKFIFLVILIPSMALSYTDKDINLSDYEYDRYIKPGLRDIIKDYFALYQSLNPEIVNSYTQYKLHAANRDLLNSSIKNTEIESIIEAVSKIKKNMMILMKENSSHLNFKDKDHYGKNYYLLHVQSITNYKRSLFDFYLKLEQVLFFSERSEYVNFCHELHSEYLTVEAAFYEFLNTSSDNRFQKEFMAFENDFVRTTQKYILNAPDKSKYLYNINQLNLTLNKLSVVLTKRNKKISKQSKSILKTMHNRWNNLLKVTLRR